MIEAQVRRHNKKIKTHHVSVSPCVLYFDV